MTRPTSAPQWIAQPGQTTEPITIEISAPGDVCDYAAVPEDGETLES